MPDTDPLSMTDREFVEWCQNYQYYTLADGYFDRLVTLSQGKRYWGRDSMCVIALLRLDLAEASEKAERVHAMLRGQYNGMREELKWANEAKERAESTLEKAKALVNRFDEVHNDPRYQSVWLLYAIHGGNYTEPKYGKELTALKDALAALDSAADAGVEAAPPRPSGTIPVTLHYAGRGVPRPLEDALDTLCGVYYGTTPHPIRCALPKGHPERPQSDNIHAGFTDEGELVTFPRDEAK